MVGNGHTDTVRVENPIFGTSCADSGFPSVATDIGNGLMRGHLTDAVVECESAVAASAGTSSIVSGTEGVDFNTNVVAIEDPEGRAFGTGLSVPIPDFAAEH